MKSSSFRQLFLLIFSCTTSFSSAQTVWPGDVNNNGVVNSVDMLYIGLAFGAKGPERATESTEWSAQPIVSLWPQSLPNGINYAYADCNGDGEVDEKDIKDAVEANFGRTHGTVLADGFTTGTAGIDPPLSLQPSVNIAAPGTTVGIHMSLGTAEQPVEEFYGLSLFFSYDSDLVNNDDDDNTKDEMEFEEAENSWINPPNRDKAEILLITKAQTGKGELAITRTDGLPITSGFGQVGRFSVVIEDIIVGLEVDTFRMRVDSLKLIDGSLRTRSIVPDSALIYITRDSNLVISKVMDRQQPPTVEIFPNPAGGAFTVISNGTAIERIRLYDLMGQPLEVFEKKWNSHEVHLTPGRRYPAGHYLIQVITKERILSKTIIFLN